MDLTHCTINSFIAVLFYSRWTVLRQSTSLPESQIKRQQTRHGPQQTTVSNQEQT